jgi:hypothetical protein
MPAQWNAELVFTVAGGQTDPLGGSSAYKVTTPGIGVKGVSKPVGSAIGAVVYESVWLRADTPISLVLTSAQGSGPGANINVTTSWQRFCVTGTVTIANDGPFIHDGTIAKTFYIWRCQWEEVIGQSVQAPAEYVSVGVLAAPYHGANIDGVKYYPNYNGNVIQQNLILQSQAIDDVAWTKRGVVAVTPNATAAPDGTLTADLVSGVNIAGVDDLFNAGYIAVTAAPNAQYTPSFYIKRVSTVGTLIVSNPSNGNTLGQWRINLALLSSGWERITESHPAVTVIVPFLSSSTGNGVGMLFSSFSGGPFSFYLWGTQANNGLRAATYVPTTAAIVNNQIVEEATGATISSTIRFGYLDEGASTNLVLRSSDFANAAWVNIGTPVVVSDSTIAPDGTTTADTLTDDDAVVFEGKQQVFVVPNDGTSYTASIYVLKTSGGTSKTFGINFSLTGGTSVVGNFRINTDTGAILAGTGTVKSIGNYWRISTPVTNNTSGNTSLTVQYYPATAANNQSLDDGTQTGSAVVWEAQVEALAFASSTIPTVAATVTRNVDALTYTLPRGYTDVAGTWVAKAGIVPGNINNNRVVSCTGNAATAISLNGPPAATGLSIYDGTNNTAAGVVNFTNAMHKAAAAWDTNGIAISTDGVAPGTAAYDGGMFTGVLSIGGAAGVSWWGCIDFVTGYPYRLTNAMLQTLST